MKDAAAPTLEQQRNAYLEGEVAKLTIRLRDTESALERLRRAYNHALEQWHLAQRRLFAAKAERREGTAEQLVFDAMFEHIKHLENELKDAEAADQDKGTGGGGDNTGKKGGKGHKPTGRRKLAESDLPVVRVEITNPELEGTAERIGFEESSRLGFERGGMRRIVLARAVYKVDATTSSVGATDADTPVVDATGADTTVLDATAAPSSTAGAVASLSIVVTPLPKELFRRSLLAPSMIAHLLVAKYMMGVPFYRLEQKFGLEGFSIDRGTMCRYAEDAGATLGAIVEAAREQAFQTAFCLSTDATGVSIQPGPLDDRGPRPCRKAHFFVILADRDHVFFEYQPKHTSAVACEMFKGFTGYIQADAHTIYDALFEGRLPRGKSPDPAQSPPPTEVGCWSHGRRKFWEAAVCKHQLGVDGLCRINAIFAADALLKDVAPARRKALRNEYVRPLVDAFFTWVREENARPRERGLVATALGYAVRQEQPLRRFLEDGRLKLENNASERALRFITTGRNAWLFFGSDDHASAAANLFSLIASCKLHRLDPESYLTDVTRVMPYWPRDRYIELAPMNWARTRARLDPRELALPLGHITVPPPLTTEQQPPPD